MAKSIKNIINKYAGRIIVKDKADIPKNSKKVYYTPNGYHIRVVMKEAGWTYDETKKAMIKAREELGISFYDYANNGFWSLSEEQQSEMADAIRKKKKKAAERKKGREQRKNKRYVKEVVLNSGMSEEEAVKKMTECREATGMSFEHYSKYRFWNVPDEEQTQYFTKGMADALKSRYNRYYELTRMFIHKNLFCEKFSEYLGRPWIYTGEMDRELFRERFQNEKKIIFKPQSSTGGSGVEVFEIDKDDIDRTYDEVSELGPGVAEGFLKQHHEMAGLSAKAVNTIRVVTIRTRRKEDGIELDKTHFLYAGLRMGSGDSYVDNMHSGGLIAAVDIDTGTVITSGVDFAYNVYDHHPDTGKKIPGFVIPYFNETKEMIDRAIRDNDVFGYYGWDIAITENGPVIIECNTHPGSEILQTPFVQLHKGMRFVVARFLGEKNYGFGPERPRKAKVLKNSGKGVRFSWNEAERATGYEIFRSYSKNGPAKMIARILSRTEKEYTDNDFDSSENEVYYSVRSFLTDENGITLYSERSEDVKAEV